MDTQQLCYLSGAEALRLFRKHDLSPLELFDAIIERAEQVEPAINAFCATYFDEARDAARAAEQRYQSGNARPLEGLTCAVKDQIKLAGRVTTGGSLVFKDQVDTETDVMAQRLIDAGAIVHARTTTPEFCLLGTTQSRIWGVTRNPYNLDYTPGGSSGGSGASLAAGTTTLGTGTDIAGSIRIPAACCGIVGLKAAYGRIPETPVFNLDFYSHSGPMTRTVADAALMFNEVAGVSSRDIASLRETVQIPAQQQPIAGSRVAWSMDLNFFEIAPDVRRNTERVLSALGDSGCELVEVDFPWNQQCDDAVRHYLNVVWGQHMKRLLSRHRDEMTDYAVRAIEEAGHSTLEDYLASLETAHSVYSKFGRLMQDFDFFVCPTNGIAAVAADHDPWMQQYKINNKTVDPEYGWILTHPFNMLSRCPVISVPSGFADNGVPTGVQLVGNTYDELTIFRAASALEPFFGFQAPDAVFQSEAAFFS